MHGITNLKHKVFL